MIGAVLACGGIVAVAEPLTIGLLRRLAVLDVPGGRSSHAVPTPRGGGLPIAIGLLVAAALASGTGGMTAAGPAPGAPGAGEAWAFGASVGFFGLVGMLDDLRGLPA